MVKFLVSFLAVSFGLIKLTSFFPRILSRVYIQGSYVLPKNNDVCVSLRKTTVIL